MKLVALVRRVTVSGINKIGTILPSGEMITQDMPDAIRVEIEIGEDGTCMFYRYGEGDAFCGDSWFETLEDAKRQGAFEFEIAEKDWVEFRS